MASVIFSAVNFSRDRLDGNVNRGERDAQPAAALVRAEQHHRGAFRAGELGEKFRLADEFVAGADDGLLVDRRGDERVQLAAQAALAAVVQRGDGGVGGGRRAGGQIFRQRRGERIGDEKFPVVGVIGKFLQRQVERQFLIEMPEKLFVTDEEMLRFIRRRLGGYGLERDFRADAGGVAEGDADPALKLRIANLNCELIFGGAASFAI